MSLPLPPRVRADQQRSSRRTIVKRSWHLLPYEQMLGLLGWIPNASGSKSGTASICAVASRAWLLYVLLCSRVARVSFFCHLFCLSRRPCLNCG
jgi:hypothetical protein